MAASFHWNYTTFLNFAFLAAGAYLYWLYRHRDQLGGGGGFAIDPTCGMQVQTANAPAQRTHDHRQYWFCSDHCAERFSQDPERFAKAPHPGDHPPHEHQPAHGTTDRDE